MMPCVVSSSRGMEFKLRRSFLDLKLQFHFILCGCLSFLCHVLVLQAGILGMVLCVCAVTVNGFINLKSGESLLCYLNKLTHA
jgi:hypothetical protein